MGGLLTDEARAWVGYEYPRKTFTVTEQDVLKFAYATGETGELHLDRFAAQKAGYRGLVAPPLYYLAVRTAAYHIVPMADFAVDGTPAGDLPPISTIRGMGGEIEVSLAGPICAGDVLEINKRVEDVREKSGRSGALIFVRFAFSIKNQNDETVVEEKFTRVFR